MTRAKEIANIVDQNIEFYECNSCCGAYDVCGVQELLEGKETFVYDDDEDVDEHSISPDEAALEITKRVKRALRDDRRALAVVFVIGKTAPNVLEQHGWTRGVSGRNPPTGNIVTQLSIGRSRP